MDAPPSEGPDDRIRAAITLFNEERFFEAHELLEEVWRQEGGETRRFLQGLIQVCAGFHHLQNGNLRGAAALLRRGSEKMSSHPPRDLRLDTGDLLNHVARAWEVIDESSRDGTSPQVALPKIRMEG